MGRVVISKAGKDKGRWFVIVGIDVDGERLILCDGKRRPIERPKRKNVIHVQFTNYFLEDVRNKLFSGEMPSNLDIKIGLDRLTEERGGV